MGEEALETWFYENKDLEAVEVADFLGDIIAAEFRLQIEDGSLRQVGNRVCQFFRICTTYKSEQGILDKLQTLPKCDLSQCKVLEGEEGRWENGEISKELEVDEDGFQTVSKKNKKAFKEPKSQQAAKEIKTNDRRENSSSSELTKPTVSDSDNAETLDDDMDLEAWMNSNKKQPEVDEDGFQTVSKKHKKA